MQIKHQQVDAGSRLKRADVREGIALHASLPAESGENPPYGIIRRVEETTSSFEARVRASTLPDCGGRSVMSVPTAISEMSSKIIPLKGRTHFKGSLRIPTSE